MFNSNALLLVFNISDGVPAKSYAEFNVSEKSRRVLCDFDSEHGWMVVMQRKNMDVDFNRTWTEYRYSIGIKNENKNKTVIERL